MTEPVK